MITPTWEMIEKLGFKLTSDAHGGGVKICFECERKGRGQVERTLTRSPDLLYGQYFPVAECPKCQLRSVLVYSVAYKRAEGAYLIGDER